MTINDKSVDGVLGTRTQGGEWEAQTIPLSYRGAKFDWQMLWKQFSSSINLIKKTRMKKKSYLLFDH